jgi:hypothetical protein
MKPQISMMTAALGKTKAMCHRNDWNFSILLTEI